MVLGLFGFLGGWPGIWLGLGLKFGQKGLKGGPGLVSLNSGSSKKGIGLLNFPFQPRKVGPIWVSKGVGEIKTFQGFLLGQTLVGTGKGN